MSSFKHSLRAEGRIQFAPRPNDMSSVSLGMVVGEALEVDCGGTEAALGWAQNAIAPLPNSMAPSSGLIAMALVNLGMAVGETEKVHCGGSDAALHRIAWLPLLRACPSYGDEEKEMLDTVLQLREHYLAQLLLRQTSPQQGLHGQTRKVMMVLCRVFDCSI